ncbi:MAG TPA: glycosyltransferase [Phnomibacter sp.]|nr:glycosyltransferase [Phnomibacter sp.]
MTNLLVSIIMPAYNAGNFIQDAIKSVRAQTYQQWELIVVNDGSTDDTAKKVEQLIETDSRIQLITQHNSKQAGARNTGIRKAKGEWIAFLDADDRWAERKLEIQIAYTNTEQADVFFSDAFVVDEKGNILGQMGAGKGMFCGDRGLSVFLEKNQVPILTSLVRHSVFEHDLFDETPGLQNAEDYELWLRLLLKNKTFFGTPESLAYYTLHPAGSTATDRTAFFAVNTALLQLAKKFPEAKNRLTEIMGTKTIAWLTENSRGKKQVVKAAKLYLDAHSQTLTSFDVWRLSTNNLIQRILKHYKAYYA